MIYFLNIMLTWKIVRVLEVSVFLFKKNDNDLFFKYYADVESCESFRGFGFIYIYIDEKEKSFFLYYIYYIFILFYLI